VSIAAAIQKGGNNLLQTLLVAAVAADAEGHGQDDSDKDNTPRNSGYHSATGVTLNST